MYSCKFTVKACDSLLSRKFMVIRQLEDHDASCTLNYTSTTKREMQCYIKKYIWYIFFFTSDYFG